MTKITLDIRVKAMRIATSIKRRKAKLNRHKVSREQLICIELERREEEIRKTGTFKEV